MMNEEEIVTFYGDLVGKNIYKIVHCVPVMLELGILCKVTIKMEISRQP
jgi:hypothetical protein